MTPRRRWPVLVVSLVGMALLILLGVWQVQRLNWKNGLIATIDNRLKDAPVSLADALKAEGDTDYLVVADTGQYLPGKDIRKLTIHQGGPGFSIITPFLSKDGILILVDRGTVPDGFKSASEALPDTVRGYLRKHVSGQGLFDADNNPDANQWYWWDVPAMLGAASVPADAKVMDVVLHRLPEAQETTPPIAPAPKAELRNNHLGYAITWFGLAAVLAVMTGLFLRGLKR
jgi:surfeit locus 1 family protein